jgi:gliding motility-associated-like protein
LPIQFFDLTAISSGSIAAWLWNFGDGNTSTDKDPNHTYLNPGTYNVSLTATSNEGCDNTFADNTGTVVVHSDPVASFGLSAYTVYIPTESVYCTNTSTGAVSYIWDFGDSTGTSVDVNPSHLYDHSGTYTITLIAINQFGCRDTFRREIIVKSEVVFPNSFTPNPTNPGDGSYDSNSINNDVFFPFTEGIEEFKLMIFNKWGELIFKSEDLKIGWNGYYRDQLCQQGAYVWKVEATFEDGEKYVKVGSVTLLR